MPGLELPLCPLAPHLAIVCPLGGGKGGVKHPAVTAHQIGLQHGVHIDPAPHGIELARKLRRREVAIDLNQRLQHPRIAASLIVSHQGAPHVRVSPIVESSVVGVGAHRLVYS